MVHAETIRQYLDLSEFVMVLTTGHSNHCDTAAEALSLLFSASNISQMAE